MNDCVFCKIVKGELPSYKLYEDDIVLVFLSIDPISNGHTLIIPKKHYIDYTDIDLETLNHINTIGKKMYNLLNEKLNFNGLKIVQNNGSFQDVKHYHMHLIPNYNNKEILSLEELYKKIKG